LIRNTDCSKKAPSPPPLELAGSTAHSPAPLTHSLSLSFPPFLTLSESLESTRTIPYVRPVNQSRAGDPTLQSITYSCAKVHDLFCHHGWFKTSPGHSAMVSK